LCSGCYRPRAWKYTGALTIASTKAESKIRTHVSTQLAGCNVRIFTTHRDYDFVYKPLITVGL
jgi:hypothetical protein